MSISWNAVNSRPIFNWPPTTTTTAATTAATTTAATSTSIVCLTLCFSSLPHPVCLAAFTE